MRRNRWVVGVVAVAMAAGLLSGAVDAGAVRIGRPAAPGNPSPRELELENSPLAAMRAAGRPPTTAPTPRALPSEALRSASLVASTDRAIWLPTDDVNDMVVDPASGRAFLSMQDEVRIYDTTGAEVGSIVGLLDPQGLAIAGGVLYVAERGRPAISQFDTTTRALIRRFPVPVVGLTDDGLVSVAFAGGRLWYLAPTAGGIVGLNPTTGAVLGTLSTQPGDGLAPSVGDRYLRAVPGNATRLVVSADEFGFVKVFDITTDTPVAVPPTCSWDSATFPVGPPAFLDGTHVVTARGGLTEWTLDGRCPARTIAPGVSGVAGASPSHAGVWAVLARTLAVYRRSDDALLREYPIDTNYPQVRARLLEFSPDGNTLFAAQRMFGGLDANRAQLLVLHPFDPPGSPVEPAPPVPPTWFADRMVETRYAPVRDLVVHTASGRVVMSTDDAVRVFDATGTLIGDVAGITAPWGLAEIGASMWVVDRATNSVVRFDPVTLAVQGSWTLAPLSEPHGLTASGGTLWAIDVSGQVLGVAAATGATVGTVAARGNEIEVVPARPARLVTITVPTGGTNQSSVIDTAPTPPVLVPSVCQGTFTSGTSKPLGSAVVVSQASSAAEYDIDRQCATGQRYVPYLLAQAIGVSGGATPIVATAQAVTNPSIEFFHAGESHAYRRATVVLDPPEVVPTGFEGSVVFSPDQKRAYAVLGRTATVGLRLVVVQLENDGPPTTSGVKPDLVSTDGGDVTVEGTNLFGAGAFLDGVTPVTVAIRSASSVVVSVPPGTAVGRHTVVLRTASGEASIDVYVVRSLGALGEFTPISPTRLLDTRDGTGQPAAGVVGPGQSIELTVLGQGGVPSSGVAAVVLNVTVVDPGAAGYLTVYPSGSAVPLASNLNFVAGQTVPNLVTVRVGAGGKVSFYNSSAFTHVLADLAGYFSSSSGPRGTRLYPISPVRVLDTRGGQPLGPADSGYIDLLEGDADLLTDRQHVKGWVMNVTVTEGTRTSFVTVWPTGQSRPLASNLNVVRGQTVPNLVMTPATEGGFVSFYNHAGSVHIIADVVGYFDDRPVGEAGRFIPLDGPTRMLDTRDTATPLVDGETRVLDLSGAASLPHPDYVAGVIANVTATGPTADTFVTVYPAGRDLPLASNLNVVAGQTVPNLVVGRTSVAGGLALYNLRGRTDLVVDVVGWFTTAVGDFAFD